MKFIVCFVFLFIFSVSSFAIQIAPKGGLNVSNFNNSANDDFAIPKVKEKSTDGLNLFVGIDKEINKNFNVGVDVMLISSYGMVFTEFFEDSEYETSIKHRITSFNSGLNPVAKYFLNIGEISRIYVHAGASFAISYNNKYKETTWLTHQYSKNRDKKIIKDKTLSGDINNFHTSIVGGLGYWYGNVIVEFRYNYGLTDLNLFKDVKSYYRVFSASIGYTFGK